MNQSQQTAEERLQQVVIFEQLNERTFLIMKDKPIKQQWPRSAKITVWVLGILLAGFAVLYYTALEASLEVPPLQVSPLKFNIMDELDAKTIEALRQRIRQKDQIQQETLRELAAVRGPGALLPGDGPL